MSGFFSRRNVAFALLVFLFGAGGAHAQGMENKTVRQAVAWSLVPGGGHYYLDEPLEGTAYAASTLGFFGAAAWLDDRNEELHREDEVNTFYLLAAKEWELSLFTTYRNAHRKAGIDLAKAGIDDTPVAELFAAPFRKQNMSDPMVVLAAMLGVAAGTYTARLPEGSVSHVREVGILGGTANQEWGSAAYAMDAFALSLAAGVTEEAAWRGVLQNELELTFGPRAGLWSASALFGVAHLADLDGEINASRVIPATIGGLYLGSMYQRDNHRLSKPIAAHFWYNFTLMLTAFALDPDDNPLGVEVNFDF